MTNKKINDDGAGEDGYEEIYEEGSSLLNFLSKDGKSLNFHINGAVSQKTLNPIISNMLQVNMGGAWIADPEQEIPLSDLEQINIFINSGGGDLTATQQLLTMMDTSIIPVRTIVWGECASAALIIAMAGHYRLVSPHSLIMSHNASFHSGRGGFQHAADMSTANMTKKLNTLMHSFYEKYTKKDIAYIKKHFLKPTKDDVYFSAKEAIEHNLMDALFTDFNQLNGD